MGEKLIVKTPGKLMVAGEFAVLERNYPLIVMAVDRFVFTTIEDHCENTFTSIDFNLHNYTWNFNGRKVIFDNYSPRLRFATIALATVFTYLKENRIKTNSVSITVRSELNDEKTGAKYGLGSSAAVVTSIISAVLEKFLKDKPAKKLIFKLAAIAHVRTQGSGSGADIAASTYGGVLHYTSFQADWLKRELYRTRNLRALVNKNWRYLTIKKITLPDNLMIKIGWTGNPASTANLVSQIANLKTVNRQAYNDFLFNSKRAVEMILQGINNSNISDILIGVKQNRKTLLTLGKVANVDLETEKLTTLSDIAEQLGGAGKFSGAGGGDCGIAFLSNKDDCTTLFEKWEKNGIKPLSMNIFNDGTTVLINE